MLAERPYRADDAAALAELMNVIDLQAGGPAGHTPDRLHRLITTMVGDPGTDSTMVFDGPRLVGAGFTTTPPDGGVHTYLTGGVHPTARGRGIGRSLLRRHLDRATELHRAIAPDASWRAIVHLPGGATDAARLLRRFAFEPTRHWFTMDAPTSIAALPPPEDVRLTPYSPEHEDDVYRAYLETFADTWGFQRRTQAEWRTLTVAAASFRPDLSFVALANLVLAGFILARDHSDPARVYLSHMGVRSQWRRRGVAGALLTNAVHAAARAGRTTATLDVDTHSPTGALTLYERIGFAPTSHVITHARPLP